MRSSLTRHGVVFLAYVAVTLAWAHFFLGSLSGHFAHDSGDPFLNSWIMWWNATTIPFSATWWNAPAFYPAAGTTAFTESLIGLTPITSPVIWLTSNPVLAHNLALLLSFPLAGVAAYWLCRELTGNDNASFVGGMAFAFAPYRIAQLPHVQVLHAWWMPVTLFALHRFLRTGRRSNLLLFGAAWIMNGVSNGYYLLFLGVLLVLWIAWFVIAPRRWSDLLPIGRAWLMASLPLALMLWQYHNIHARYGFQRHVTEIEFFSADVAALATAARDLSLWGWVSRFQRPEGELFPGVWLPAILLVSSCLALALGTPRARWWTPHRRLRPLRFLLAGVAGVELAVVALIGLLGPLRTRIGGIRVAVSSAEQPLFIATVAIVVLMATRRRNRETPRSPAIFYGAAACLMWLLTLGPVPKFFGRPILSAPWQVLAPYAWLLALPGFDSLRAPARFWMVAVLCLAVAAAMLLTRVLPASRWWRGAITAVLACGILSDAWASALPVVTAPRILNCPRPPGDAAALALLPLGDTRNDLAAMDLARQWGLKSVNGYSGYVAPHYEAVAYGIDTSDHGTLSDLAADTGLFVGLPDENRMLHRFVRTHPRATSLGVCGNTAFFRISPDAPLAGNEQPAGTALPIVTITADVGPDDARLAIDGDLFTRWHSGEQSVDHFLQVDLGAERSVAAVVFELGPVPGDFPRYLHIKVSADGVSWSEAWAGPTHRMAFRAGLSDPKRMPLTLSFVPTRARYMRFEQTGRDAEFWSVPELRILTR
ncbi:MAG: discoidin domain-containing protein [Vicinamibacterales bacterium]